MERLTKTQTDRENYLVDGTFVTLASNGYAGEAVDRLAKFENFYDDLLASQIKIPEDLEKLRKEGKEKTTKFRELMGKKLINMNILIILKAYGLK